MEGTTNVHAAVAHARYLVILRDILNIETTQKIIHRYLGQ